MEPGGVRVYSHCSEALTAAYSRFDGLLHALSLVVLVNQTDQDPRRDPEPSYLLELLLYYSGDFSEVETVLIVVVD